MVVVQRGNTIFAEPPTARQLPRPLAMFTVQRTWTELLFAVLGLPLGVFGFTFTVFTLTGSIGLAVTFVGLPLLAATGMLSRVFGGWLRRMTNRLTGSSIAAPRPFRANPGLLGWIGSCLTDGTAWRARLYLLLKLPLGILTSVAATTLWSYGLGGLTYPIWRPLLPCNHDDRGVCHRGVGLADNVYLDSWWRIVLTALAGLLILSITPLLVHLVVQADVFAARMLLGPTQRDDRVRDLERTRAVAVEDAATTLRRIERDLHDGAQARLVTLAMNVGLAREKLAEGGDPTEANQLLDTAHATAKQAIAELRDLARGIHPPVLDAGLDTAVSTLAATSAVPTDLHTSLARRPAGAVETIAYFCAAELLTNVAKHSGAARASLDVRTSGDRLVLVVADDGHGGAHVGGGTGLRGLSDRVATVDGRLMIDSPPGGPTRVTVELPMELA